MLSPALTHLAGQLELCAARSGDDNVMHEFKAQQGRAITLAGAIEAIVSHTLEGHVYYAHVPKPQPGGFNRSGPSLSASPLSVAPMLGERLFGALAHDGEAPLDALEGPDSDSETPALAK